LTRVYEWVWLLKIYSFMGFVWESWKEGGKEMVEGVGKRKW